MKAELVPENGDPPIPIVRDVTILGRHRDCDVVIGHPSLSKRHCLLVKTDGLLVIRDLATTNGTKVKGQRVRWAALLPEDRVSFGAYRTRIYLGSDEMPSPSEQRLATNGAAGSRAPGDVRAGVSQGLSPIAKKAAPSPPTPAPRSLPSVFPGPAHDGTAAAKWGGASYEPNVSQQPGAAEPLSLDGDFKFVEDDVDAGAAGAIEGSFEFVEDDDFVELD